MSPALSCRAGDAELQQQLLLFGGQVELDLCGAVDSSWGGWPGIFHTNIIPRYTGPANAVRPAEFLHNLSNILDSSLNIEHEESEEETVPHRPLTAIARQLDKDTNKDSVYNQD